MNDATLPWTVSDLILFFKQQKIKDLHFFLNWYRYLCCELVKLNFDGTVPFYPLPQKSPAPRQWQPKLKEQVVGKLLRSIVPVCSVADSVLHLLAGFRSGIFSTALEWHSVLQEVDGISKIEIKIPHLKVQIKLVKCFTNIVRIRTVFNIYVSGSEQKSENGTGSQCRLLFLIENSYSFLLHI